MQNPTHFIEAYEVADEDKEIIGNKPRCTPAFPLSILEEVVKDTQIADFKTVAIFKIKAK